MTIVSHRNQITEIPYDGHSGDSSLGARSPSLDRSLRLWFQCCLWDFLLFLVLPDDGFSDVQCGWLRIMFRILIIMSNVLFTELSLSL